MAQVVREVGAVLEAPFAPKYNLLQRYALLKAHPRKAYFDAAVLPWAIHYLWQGKWGLALSLWLLGSVASFIAVADSDTQKLGETIYGKIILLHVRPTNIFFHLVGYVFLIQGLLAHSTQSILISVSSIFLGHLVGWNDVHPCFKRKRE